MATNLENLEYAWNSLNLENSGNSLEIMCNLEEMASVTRCHFRDAKISVKYVCSQGSTPDSARGAYGAPMMTIITITVCCDNL